MIIAYYYNGAGWHFYVRIRALMDWCTACNECEWIVPGTIKD